METVTAERAGGVAPIVQGAGLGLPARAMPAPGGSEWLRIGVVALAVRDLDRMEAFYRYAIGLEDVARGPGLVRLGVGERAFLDLLHRPDALPDDPAGAGLFHTAFLLPSRADLGRWLAHAARLRLRLDGAADHLVSEAVYLSDPEGNGIEVYADRPRASWGWSDLPAGDGEAGRPAGRHVEMANRPLDRAGLLREAEEGGRPWAGAPDGTHIGHVHLRVGDVAEAGRFYGGVIGLDVTASRPDALFLSTGGYHHHLAANTWHSRGAGPRDPRRSGLASVTFDVTSDGAGGVPGGGRLPAEVAAHLGGAALPDPWGTALRFRAA